MDLQKRNRPYSPFVEAMSDNTPLLSAGQIYRHYKRQDEYRIVCIAVIEATEEPCVVYEALYPSAKQRYWIRPVTDFCAEVSFEGAVVPRFLQVSA